MAVTVTDRRTIQTEADSTTGWTNATAADTNQYAEASASVAAQFNITTNQLYYTGTARNLGTSPGTLVYVYTWNSAFRLGVATGAHTLLLGDGTNQVGFHMSGNDREAFSHSDGPVVWQNFVLDTSQASALNTAGANFRTVYSGAFASMDWANITEYGSGFITQSKALGGGYNCFVDIIRFGNDGIRVTGGGSGTEGTFLEVVTEDRSTATLKAHGVIRELTTGVYGIQSPITFGDSGNATNSYFIDSNITLAYEDRYIGDDKYYFNIEGNSGATNVFELYDSVITTAGPLVTCNFASGNINTLVFDGVTFTQLGNGITFSNAADASGHSVTDCTFNVCGQIDPGDVTFDNCTISNTTDANGGLLIDADGTANLSGLTFVSDGTGHAIYITAAGNYTLTDFNYVGYGSTGTTNAAVYNNSGGTVNLTILGGTSPTYRNGATGTPVTNIIAEVTVNITVQDAATDPIENAVVAVYNASTHAEISNELTNASGLSSFTMAATTNFYARIRKSTTASTRYFPIETIGNSGTTGTSLTVTLLEDTIASP